MEHFNKAMVLMLPTSHSNIALTNSIKEYAIGSHRSDDYLQGGGKWIYQSDMSGECKPQHLYIISNDEIKEGDWCLTGLKIVRQCNGFTYSQDGKTVNGYTFTDGTADTFSSCKKIIATTDTSLTVNTYYEIEGNQKIQLTEPHQEFIEQYIKYYNNGNIITDVLVKYEKCSHKTCNNGCDSQMCRNKHHKPKINLKNNTITIKTINQKGKHILKFVKDFISEFPNENLEYLQLRAESWIEQNL
jgi:hypothetical protein